MEQLRVHVRNLGMLGVDGATNSEGCADVWDMFRVDKVADILR